MARFQLCALGAAAMVLSACSLSSTGQASSTVSHQANPPAGEPPETADPVLVPDLIGLTSNETGRMLARVEKAAGVELSSGWGRPVIVRCGVRPGVVVRQRPAAGQPLPEDGMVDFRPSALDLARFRGPCEPLHGDLGPLRGADAALARQFYRFAADPTLGAPFVPGEVWVGIANGPTAVWLDASERPDLSAWQVGTGYAERMGPFSALDIAAASGGYYQLRPGILGDCPGPPGRAPRELAGLRAISLEAPADVVGACLDWWGLTLFLSDDDEIAGVALRLGSP